MGARVSMWRSMSWMVMISNILLFLSKHGQLSSVFSPPFSSIFQLFRMGVEDMKRQPHAAWSQAPLKLDHKHFPTISDGVEDMKRQPHVAWSQAPLKLDPFVAML